jgi:hypothetical protein
MRLLVSGATRTLRRLINYDPSLAKYLGVLLTPQNGNSINTMPGYYWAADNAAFSKPDIEKFKRMIWSIWSRDRFRIPEWVAVPDVVGDHNATLALFHAWVAEWEYEVGYVPIPLAFVLQNGATIASVPWDQIDAVFVGGDDWFKLKGCHKLIDHAKSREKIVHIGRVNSLKRLKYAIEMDADSVDGSGFSRFPDKRIAWAARYIRKLFNQGVLF